MDLAHARDQDGAAISRLHLRPRRAAVARHPFASRQPMMSGDVPDEIIAEIRARGRN
jgi:hypothetical protein